MLYIVKFQHPYYQIEDSGVRGEIMNEPGIILPGTYNPIHLAHFDMAERFPGRVYFFPHDWHPEVKKPALYHFRLLMLEEALKHLDTDRIGIIERERLTLTPEQAWMSFHNLDKQVSLGFGVDNIERARDLSEGETWEGRRIYLFTRPGAECDTEPLERLGYDVEILDLSQEYEGISSSLIREKARRGESLEGLVPPGVEDIIKEHNLYC